MTYPIWFVLTVALSVVALIAMSVARGFNVQFMGWGFKFIATKPDEEPGKVDKPTTYH